MDEEQKEQNLFSEEWQQEVDKLSWEFLLKEKEDKEETFLEMEAENKAEGKTVEVGGVDDYYKKNEKLEGPEQNLDFWQWHDDSININDLQRGKGIIFDEEKLAAEKIVAWNKAPKLRESPWQQWAQRVLAVFGWPFKLAIKLAVGVTTFIGQKSIGLVRIIYKICQLAVMLSWQFIMAFGHAFVYLFGETDWWKTRELQAVGVESEINPPVYRRYNRWRGLSMFVLVALVLILPLQGYLSWDQANKTKGEVLGASEFGVAHLLQAGVASKNFDWQSAGREFTLAGQKFTEAEAGFKKIKVLSAGAAAVVPEVKAGEQLLILASKSAEVGRILTGIGSVFKETDWPAKGLESVMEPQAGQVSSGNKDNIDWDNILRELDRAVNEAAEIQKMTEEIDWQAVRVAGYEESLAAVKTQIPKLVSWLSNCRDLTRMSADFLGVDEPKRWLMVFQNNTEIRPTGGFMGSYALVDIDQGKIKKITVPGGGFYDLKGSLAVTVDAPYPFHVFSPIWQPWNANWFPDWPTSAEKIMWFYDKSGGPSVDGVIGFTPKVLVALLKLTGPIAMPEYGLTVESENFIRTAQTQVEFNYDKEENKPKKFIGDLLPKLLDKIFALQGESRLGAFTTFFDSLRTKDILIYAKNQKTQALADQLNWTGRIAQYDKDYLAVIHTNIAGGKTDGVIKNKIEHQAEVGADGTVIDTVTLTREHQGRPDDVFEGQTNSDYVRFYVPAGSQLLSASSFDGLPAGRQFLTATSGLESDPDLLKNEKNLKVEQNSGTRITEEFGKTVFGNWLTVAPGQTKSVTIKYLLPWRLTEWPQNAKGGQQVSWWVLVKRYFGWGPDAEEVNEPGLIYGLLAQKQPGSQAYFTSTLKIDDHWRVGEYLPKGEGIERGENFLQASFDWADDKYYGVILYPR